MKQLLAQTDKVHYYPAVCDRCGEWCKSTTLRRMNTQYADNASNFTTQCTPCFEVTQDEWDERWREYYGGVL